MKKILAITIFSILLLAACGERDIRYDAFATCIADSGAKFYGAFWCPHCKNQKELFGDSVDLLPYVECAEGGKNAQVELCKEENIQQYPTWKFKNGELRTGEQTFQELSELTNCPLPGNETVLRKNP